MGFVKITVIARQAPVPSLSTASRYNTAVQAHLYLFACVQKRHSWRRESQEYVYMEVIIF